MSDIVSLIIQVKYKSLIISIEEDCPDFCLYLLSQFEALQLTRKFKAEILEKPRGPDLYERTGS